MVIWLFFSIFGKLRDNAWNIAVIRCPLHLNSLILIFSAIYQYYGYHSVENWNWIQDVAVSVNFTALIIQSTSEKIPFNFNFRSVCFGENFMNRCINSSSHWFCRIIALFLNQRIIACLFRQLQYYEYATMRKKIIKLCQAYEKPKRNYAVSEQRHNFIILTVVMKTIQ